MRVNAAYTQSWWEWRNNYYIMGGRFTREYAAADHRRSPELLVSRCLLTRIDAIDGGKIWMCVTRMTPICCLPWVHMRQTTFFWKKHIPHVLCKINGNPICTLNMYYWYVLESEFIAKAGWNSIWHKKIESNFVKFNLCFLLLIFQDSNFSNFNNVGKISLFQVSTNGYWNAWKIQDKLLK